MSRIYRSKITLADVARKAHVSISTASKALRNTGRISAETRRIVLAAARELGYEGTGSTNPKSPSGLIGLITSDRNGRFSLPLLIGAESTLGASNHAALLMVTRGEEKIESSHINQLAARGVDGIIVVGDTTNPREPLGPRLTRGLPVVYAYDPSKCEDDASVTCDNVGAGRQAIEYLIGQGRKAIAIVGGSSAFKASKDRIRGALQSFRIYGMEPLMILPDRWSEEWGEHAANLLVIEKPSVDAIYCLSDEIARGVARAIMKTGRNIPTDVAIIGHDNWDIFSMSAHPTLTTFDNNMQEIGKLAARLLRDKINGMERRGEFPIECSMIIRESTDESHHTTIRGSGFYSGLEES